METYPVGTERRRAAEFLVSGLSAGEAATLTAVDLHENLEYAFKARGAMPWGQSVPFELFLRYVLPHRAASEVFKPWRARFYKELAQVAGAASSMEEAALLINLWCLEQANYQATEGYALAAVDVISRGYGRCGELSSLYTLAARSVGIPARYVLVPLWQHTDSNHGWVEVWTGDGWHFLGASEPSPSLDQGWFAQHLGKAPLVVALAYGGPSGINEHVFHGKRGVTVVNRTDAYAPTGQLTVMATEKGEPVSDAIVSLSVFNSGYMRILAAKSSDKEGKCSFLLGCGTYLVQIRSGRGVDWAVAHVGPDDEKRISLDYSAMRTPSGSIELEFCSQEMLLDARPKDAGFSLNMADLTHREATANANRALRLKQRRRAVESTLATFGEPCMPHVLRRIKEASGNNFKALLSFIQELPQRLRVAGCTTLETLSAKDIVSMSSDQLRENTAMAVAARNTRNWPNETSELFLKHVLLPQVDSEPPSGWRTLYVQSFMGYFQVPPDEAAYRVGRWAGKLKVSSDGYSSPLMTPREMILSGHCRNDRERRIAAGAALKSLGIPVLKNQGLYFNGEQWKPIPIIIPDMETKDSSTEASGPVQSYSPVTIELSRLVPDFDAEAQGEPAPAYYREFAIVQLSANGFFEPVDPDSRPGLRERTITLDAGEYFLIRGKRNESGAVVEITPFSTSDPGVTE